MLLWDNQQATKFGWFIGILDGEGCYQENDYYGKWVKIYNTDLDIIAECEKILRENHILFTTQLNYRENRKPICVIVIKNRDVDALYNLLQPYLECRINEFQSILGASQSIRDPSVDLNWLVGIWEAEGWISLRNNGTGYGKVEIGLDNTNKLIISKAIKCLRAIRVSYCLYDHRVKERPIENNCYKSQRDIRIFSMGSCQRFLWMMKDRWVSQRNIDRSELMREYINSRLSMKKSQPLTSRQTQVIQAMYSLNR